MTTFGVTSKGRNPMPKGDLKTAEEVGGCTVHLHAWCEDEAGNVIFDPFFDEYFDIMEEHDCVGNTGSVHMPQRYGRIYKKRPEWQPIVQAVIKGMIKRMLRRGVIASQYYKPPQYGCCMYNAYFYKLQQNPKAKICVGQMGWKTADGCNVWAFG